MANDKGRNKKKSGGRPRSYSEVYKNSDATPSSGGGAAPTASASEANKESSAAGGAKGSDLVDWQGEYGYVVKDLRTLFIVSGVLFAVIIGVGLVI